MRAEARIQPLVAAAVADAEAAECADLSGTLEVLLRAVSERASAQRITVAATFQGNVLTFERITLH